MRNVSNKKLILEIAKSLANSNTKRFFTEDDIWEFLDEKYLDINGNDVFNECCNSPLFDEIGYNQDTGYLEFDLINIYCEPVIILKRSEKSKTPRPLMHQEEIDKLLN